MHLNICEVKKTNNEKKNGYRVFGFFVFYERTEVHGSVLQWGLDGHG